MQIHGIHAPNDENPAPAGVPCTGGTFCGPLECRHQDGVLHAPSVLRPDPRFQAFHLHWKSILLLRLGRHIWEMLGRSWKVQKDAGLVWISYVDVCSFVFIYELSMMVFFRCNHLPAGPPCGSSHLPPGDSQIGNRVLEALFRRIVKAHEQRDAGFHVVIVLPLLPALEGPLCQANASLPTDICFRKLWTVVTVGSKFFDL